MRRSCARLLGTHSRKDRLEGPSLMRSRICDTASRAHPCVVLQNLARAPTAALSVVSPPRLGAPLSAAGYQDSLGLSAMWRRASRSSEMSQVGE
eukprot:51755-Pyramimonas_sp.AAC.1